MQRLSIARSLRLALIGLTLILAGIAALGVASLYSSRQNYENTLVSSSQLASASANLAAASVVLETVARQIHGRPSAAQRQVAVTYEQAERRALSLAHPDPVSLRLLRREINAPTAGAALAAAAAVQNHQSNRQQSARAVARTRSRQALVLILIAGMIALIGALVVVAGLIGSMRRPLDELVNATRAMAAGDLRRRVSEAGPRELRQLSHAFNAMGQELEVAAGRLQHERNRLATIIASLGDGLIVTDANSQMIANHNPQAGKLLPAIGVGARLDTMALPPVEELLGDERTIEIDGRTLGVSAARLPGDVEEDGGYVLTIRDMSAWARLDRAKAEFIATASHELRSPLTSIKGFVELLANTPGHMSERQREFISIILRSTDRLVDLVNDLLDVASLEAAQVEMHPRAVDVTAIVTELVELIGPRVTAKRQSLTVEMGPALPLVLADPGRLRQILQNLLTNAHLYTQEAGRLQITCDAHSGYVRVSIADTGPGMPPEQLEHIFDRFYRGRQDHDAPGTGLGLSIVKSLVDLHEGRVEVASEPGRGTTFRVSIPVAQAGTPGMLPALEALRGRVVLIVDDERELASLIAEQLHPFDVSTVIAQSGAEALELLHRRRFDAITMDVRMPEMDGLELLTRIRADPEISASPIVFVSVFTSMDELSGEWIVSKPVDPDELREVLATAVSSGRSRVLVVARETLRDRLAPALEAVRIEFRWETSGVAAARACSEMLFELALIDVGLSNPQAVLAALTLRGRRRRRAVILVHDGQDPLVPSVSALGLEVVSVAGAARALADALGFDRRGSFAKNRQIAR